jgi:hypothetical protein
VISLLLIAGGAGLFTVRHIRRRRASALAGAEPPDTTVILS